MLVVFRVDASIHIGSGHVMRCLVLARALQSRNVSISFACLPLSSDMRSYIEQQGFLVQSLTPTHKLVEPLNSADYQGWLQRPVAEDAIDFLDTVDLADWVVTDHYAIDAEWHTIVKDRLGCRVLAIDDLVRVHSADVIIDQTLNRRACEYHSTGIVLAGTDFALLNRFFAQKRCLAERRELSNCKFKILLSMGGIDAPNATMRILNSLSSLTGFECTVLLSERSPHFVEVKNWCKNRVDYTHIAFTDNMPKMMLKHDIAIGAPGSTSWERACLGLPSIIVPLAENQHRICQELVASGAALQVDIENISSQLPSAINILLNDWQEYVERNLSLCDGHGVERVIDIIMELSCEHHLVM